jgi:hypothetical protein
MTLRGEVLRAGGLPGARQAGPDAPGSLRLQERGAPGAQPDV